MDQDQGPDTVAIALQGAARALESGNPKGMLECLYSSYFLDGLARGIRRRWPSLSADDSEFVIAQAVDALYTSVAKGKKVLSLAAFLWKVADRKANDFHERRLREKTVEPQELQELADKTLSVPALCDGFDQSEPELDHDRRRAEAIRIARGLVPRLGQQNIQSVFSYVLDALQAGEVDVSNQEIATALGISTETVRTSLSRGFARLTRIAREEGLAETANTFGAFSTALQSDAPED
jgi:DNA-directed RNA polymerase specialized sigma24 family protein